MKSFFITVLYCAIIFLLPLQIKITQKAHIDKSYAKAEVPQNEQRDFSCENYLPQIQKDLNEMNKPIDGGFLWKNDRHILAFSIRVEAAIQQYKTICNPKQFDSKICATFIVYMQKQLEQTENNDKGEITQSAYAKRARTNAYAFSELCPNTFAFQKNTCDILKEKAYKEFVYSTRVSKNDSVTLHATRSTVYHKIQQMFCE